MDVEQRIARLADAIWRGEDAKHQLALLLRADPGTPGPTRVAELTDYYYRPEHVSRIAHGTGDLRRKVRRRAEPENRAGKS